MSLSTIPDICLLTILDRIQLQDLLSTVNLVCHRWAQLRPVACHRRHSLFLYDNHKIIKHESEEHESICPPEIQAEVIDSDGKDHFGRLTHFNALRLPELNDRACQQLVTLLPAITKLKIGQSVKWWPSVVYYVNQLLKNWSTKLVHCSLWLYSEHKSEHINEGCSHSLIDSLFHRLNQLTSLKRLSIHFCIVSLGYDYVTVVKDEKLTTSLCPALSRVENFDYGWYLYDHFGGHIYRDIECALEKADCTLKTITLDPRTPLWRVAQFSGQFTAKLTNYRVQQYSGTDVLLTLLPRFNSLSTLALDGDFNRLNLPFGQLIGHLSHLNQLKLLKFYDGIDYFFGDQLPTDVPQIGLPSVKALVITFGAPFSHSHIDRLSIPTLLPNVQVIKLFQYNWPKSGQFEFFVACADCGYHFSDVYEKMDDAADQRSSVLHNCARQSVKSLKQCATLRWINFTRQCTSSDDFDDHVFSCNFTWDQI